VKRGTLEERSSPKPPQQNSPCRKKDALRQKEKRAGPSGNKGGISIEATLGKKREKNLLLRKREKGIAPITKASSRKKKDASREKGIHNHGS